MVPMKNKHNNVGIGNQLTILIMIEVLVYEIINSLENFIKLKLKRKIT